MNTLFTVVLLCIFSGKDSTVADTVKIDMISSTPQSTTIVIKETGTDYLSIALTVGVLLLAAAQLYAQHQQGEFAKFERRIKVIEDVRKVITDIDKFHSGHPSKVDLESFRIAYRHSRFLFDGNIQEYLKGIDKMIGDLEAIENSLHDFPEQNGKRLDQKALIDKIRALRPAFDSKFEAVMKSY